MIGTFVWITTFIMGFLGLIWSRNDWFNCLIKFGMFVMAVIGIVILYQQNGFTGIPLK